MPMAKIARNGFTICTEITGSVAALSRPPMPRIWRARHAPPIFLVLLEVMTSHGFQHEKIREVLSEVQRSDMQQRATASERCHRNVVGFCQSRDFFGLGKPSAPADVGVDELENPFFQNLAELPPRPQPLAENERDGGFILNRSVCVQIVLRKHFLEPFRDIAHRGHRVLLHRLRRSAVTRGGANTERLESGARVLRGHAKNLAPFEVRGSRRDVGSRERPPQRSA